MPIITDLADKGKTGLGRLPTGVLAAIAIVLACGGSFGLGYLSGKESGGGEIIIQGATTASEKESVAETSSTASLSAAAVVATPRAPAPTVDEAPLPSGGGQYVASKSGKSYHLPWCAGAKQIKEENKIYFNSKAEAEAAGYAPAKNCKGI